MTREVAVSMFEKEVKCFNTPTEQCSDVGCLDCENYVNEYDIHEAMRVAIDILKNGEEDGQKGETSATASQTAE